MTQIFYHEVFGSDAININTLNIETVNAIHAVPCISCVINCEGKKLVYTSDTLFNDALISKAQSTDILVSEGMMPRSMELLANKVKHSTAFVAGQFARQVKAKQLLLVHIAPSCLGKESMLINEASVSYEGAISIPHDGSVYKV